MPYGKSRLTFQPFLCKSENPNASLAGDATESNPALTGAKIEVVSSASLNSVDGSINKIKTDRDSKNPIQILEEMNIQRNLRVPTKNDVPAFISSDVKKLEQKETPDDGAKTQQPSASLPQQQRSWQKAKPSSGTANIYWRSVDVDDLRTHPFFYR